MKTLPEILEETKNIFALLCEEDKAALYKYASQVPENGIIVDIGTAAGGSAIIMALSSKPSVRVITIDPTENPQLTENALKSGVGERIEFYKNTSSDAFLLLKDKDLDMLFIDGIHSYHGVKDDFETFGSKVKKGGIVAFHDIRLYDNTIGKYVEELVEKGEVTHLETIDAKYQNDDRLVGLFIGEKV